MNIEEINGNNYLILISTNENKKLIKENMENYGLKSAI